MHRFLAFFDCSAAFAPPPTLRCGHCGLKRRDFLRFAMVLKAMASDLSVEIKEFRTIFTLAAAVSDIEGIERAIEDRSAGCCTRFVDDGECAERTVAGAVGTRIVCVCCFY